MSYYNRNRKRTLWDRAEDNFEAILGFGGVFLVLAFIGLILWSTYAWVNDKQTYSNCKVLSKESVTKDKAHEYRIHTDKCGVLTVKDEAWLGKFNSADTYGRLEQGKTYTFDTVGWRNGFFSTFENIVEAR